MAKDDRDILELLKDELAFIEQGGYGRSVRTPWLPKSAFEDSLICINFAYQYRAHSCNTNFNLYSSFINIDNSLVGRARSMNIECRSRFVPTNMTFFQTLFLKTSSARNHKTKAIFF